MIKNIATFRPLKTLLLIHGLITLAAGLVLIIVPPAIPRIVNIAISPNAYLICYLLAAAELSIAFLSFFSWQLKSSQALVLISSTFIIFHITTAALEAVALARGTSTAILFNILLRITISLLFGYFGIYRMVSKDRK